MLEGLFANELTNVVSLLAGNRVAADFPVLDGRKVPVGKKHPFLPNSLQNWHITYACNAKSFG